MLIPMPSPLGSNKERLFIKVRSGPRAAYDGAEGLPERSKLLDFLRDKISPADLASVETMLAGSSEDEDVNDRLTMDARTRRRGSFNTRFPDAAKIKTV